MNTNPFVSICILSYNRPETLMRLLKTIDTKQIEDIEIVVCEDCSPRQKEIRQVISEYREIQKYKVLYTENSKNLGYDGTLCELVKQANGLWLVFMGDDDEFVPGALDKVIDFLGQHPELGYVLKSHYLIHDNQKKERFRYFSQTVFFKPGKATYIELFRKSVFIAGFMIRRDYAKPYLTNRFDGTLLMQLYLLAEVVMRFPAAYFDEPFTQQYASHEHNVGDVMFDREKNTFVPRRPTLDISLNFLKSFSLITEYIDEQHQINSTALIKKDMSKIFLPKSSSASR
jgi:abequosyltransferase